MYQIYVRQVIEAVGVDGALRPSRHEPQRRRVVRLTLEQHLHDVDGMTVLMVSHLLNTVVNYAKRIAIVGDGTLREGDVSAMVTGPSLTGSKRTS